jgi:uncharacterized protein (TIGR00255 family)
MMVSMTGFASLVREDDQAVVSVTLRSVNHRFLDVQVRLPQSLGALESVVKALVQKRVSRGRVDVFVGVQYKVLPAAQVEVNLPVIQALDAALTEARAKGYVEGPLTPGDLLRVPQGVVFREPAEAGPDATAVQAVVEQAIDAGVVELNRMRAREGEMLRRDLDSRRAGLDASITTIAAAAETGRVDAEARLAARVRELSLDPTIEPGVIAQEVVRFVSRSDISEEIVRFRAHLDHWARLTESGEPCGRKLDFLLQEMNREINTIGSKAEGTRVPELVVHVKAELERMREQIQNVE